MVSRQLLVIVFLAGTAFAQERWDHRGSVGLLTGVGVEGRTSIGVMQSDSGARLLPEVGGTLALSERWHLKLAGRLALLGPQVGVMILAGVRSTYGQRFKTFFDLDASVNAVPLFTIGPRVAFGVQYELAEIVGAFASAGVNFGVGPAGARLGFELMIGLQFRSYLLE
ncbi:MAG: hypothetical protein MUC96_16325 [Myxococcaceae bacterium]|nr:hypothetical protein [Myxococcaceae bacterium]